MLSTIGQKTGNKLELTSKLALLLPGAVGCQFWNISVHHWYFCIDISEIVGVSRATAANPWIIGITVSMLESRRIFRENDANVPTTHEGKCFEGAAFGLPCAFVS